MYIIRVNGQDITNTAVGQEFARDFHDHGGRADVQPNGDLIINVTTDQYMRAVDRQVTRESANIAHQAQRFAQDARTMLREARSAHAPVSPQPGARPAQNGPLSQDDLNELGRISDGSYDNLSWLNGVL
jgi:hypothetical protein